MAIKKVKPYGDGNYTEAAFRSFLIAGLRDKSTRWAPKSSAKKKARKGKLVNPRTGRDCIANLCAICGGRFLEKETHVDHKSPIVPLTGFNGETWLGYNWTELMQRLFCEAGGFQVLCAECHSVKTNHERELRVRYRNAK